MDHTASKDDLWHLPDAKVLVDVDEKALDAILGPLSNGAGVDDNFIGLLP